MKKNILLFILILSAVILFIITGFYDASWLRFFVLFSSLLLWSLYLIVQTLSSVKSGDSDSPVSQPPLLLSSSSPSPHLSSSSFFGFSHLSSDRQKAVKFLLAVFVVSLILRITFTLFVHRNSMVNGGEGYYFKYVYSRGQDDEFYHRTGQAVAEAWKEGNLLNLREIFNYRGGVHIGYNLFTAFIYYLCGSNILFGKLINCLLGSLIVVYVFFIGWMLFGYSTARLAAVISSVDTYLIFFGGYLYKDLIIAFLALFCIWEFLLYIKMGNRRALFWTAFGILFAFFNRTYMGAALGGAIFAYFLVFGAPKEKMRRMIYFMVLLILSSPFFYIFFRIARSQLGSRVVRIRGEEGGVEDTGVDDTRVYGVKRLVVNSLRIFVSPIPWRNLKGSWENIFYWVYPGKLLWYIFMPFFFVGMYYGIRFKFCDVFVPGAVMIQYMVVLMIVMQTAYRHQVPIVPLMTLTASAGFCKVKNPLLPYLIYFPCLALFFFYDNDLLKEGAFLLLFLGVVFAGYMIYTFYKKGLKLTAAGSRL